MPKDSFIFYRSFQDAIEQCPVNDQLTIYKAISQYALDREEPDMEGIARVVWVLIKPQLDANWKRYENGKKGGAPVGNSNAVKEKTTGKQPKTTKKQPNVNANANENVFNANDKEVSKDTGTKVPSFSFKNELLSLGVEKQIADDWLKVRSKKKAANTKTAFNGFKREISKSGLSPNECVRIAAERGWIAFKSDWIEPKTETGFSPGQQYYKKGEYSWK